MKFKLTSACSDAVGFKIFLKELIIVYIKLIGSDEEASLNFKITKKKHLRMKRKKRDFVKIIFV